MLTPLITEIQRFSLRDGPGFRTTIYLKGCPLHCPWCHSPETLNIKSEFFFYEDKCTVCGRCSKVCTSGALELVYSPTKETVLSYDRRKCILCMKCVDACLFGAREVVGKFLDIDSIVREVVADEMFYKHSGGGVTISGGEPLLFPDFTLDLAGVLKTKEKVHVTIETCCVGQWSKIEPLLAFVDLFIVDLKSMDPEKYKYIIGGSLQEILSNIENLINFKAAVRICLPIIPGFNDSIADINAYADYLGQFAERLSGVVVLPYHSYAKDKYAQLGREYQYEGINDLSSKQLMHLVKALQQKGLRRVAVVGVLERNSSMRTEGINRQVLSVN